MGLETVTYPADLNPANPTSEDGVDFGDNHLRNIKLAILDAFAGFTGQILVKGTEAQGTTTNNYIVTVAIGAGTPPAAYQDGMIVVSKATHTSTGSGGCTFRTAGLLELPLKGIRGETLMAGDITNGDLFASIYDAGSVTWRLLTGNDRVSRSGDTITGTLAIVGALALTGNLTVSGTGAFGGAVTGITAGAGDNTLKLATTEFVTAAVFGASATLPGQTGKGGLALATDGAAANWGVGSAALSLHQLGIV